MTDIELANRYVALNASATSRGIPFTLSLKKFKQLVATTKCYYTGVTFDNHQNRVRSVDRVDASLGYADNNVVVCLATFNGKKNNLTIAEIENLYKRVQQFKRKNKNEKTIPVAKAKVSKKALHN